MRQRLSRPVAATVVAFLLASGCDPKPGPEPAGPPEPPGPEATAPPLYEDVTAASGIDFTYRNGEDTANHLSILESLGGGAGLIDFDRDGLLDVFLTGGGGYAGPDHKQIVGRPCKLYRNLGGGKFADVTAAAGLDRPSTGTAAGLPSRAATRLRKSST